MTLLLGGYNILYSGNNSTAKYLFNLHVDLVIDILLKAVSHFFVLYAPVTYTHTFLLFPATLRYYRKSAQLS